MTTIVPATMLQVPQVSQVLSGLKLSNGTDATNDIDVAVGYASDANGYVYRLNSAMTKQLDAAFAAGSAAGGLFTGSIANTTYHMILIRNTTTEALDVGFDTSPTGANKPVGYEVVCRIGSILRESGSIVGFKQFGDLFLRNVGALDASAVTVGTSVVTQALSVPAGLNLIAKFKFSGVRSATSVAFSIWSPMQTDQTANNTAGDLINAGAIIAGATSVQTATDLAILTDTSRQIKMISNVAGQSTYINTYGWIDPRGKDL